MSAVAAQPVEHRPKSVSAILHGMLGKVLIVGINMLTGVITARALQPAGRGEQSVMVLWPVFLVNATSLGLPSAITYQLRRSKHNPRELVGAALMLALMASCISCLVVGLAMPSMLGQQYSPEVVYYARLFLLTIPLSSLTLIARATFEANERFSVSITTQWYIPLVTLLSLLVLWALHVLTPVTAAAAYTLNVIPIAVLLFYRLYRWLPPEIPRSLMAAKVLLSYGIRSLGIDLCTTLAAYVDQAFVVKMLDPKAMGTYVVALSASRVLNFCQASVVMVLLPKASGASHDKAIDMGAKAARQSMFITALMAAGVAAVAPIALRVVYGPGFEGAVPVLRILLVEVTISGTIQVLAQSAMAVGRPGLIAMLQGMGLSLVVPLLWILVPLYGIVGAALALLTSTSIRLFSLLLAFPFVLKVRTPDLRIGVKDIKEIWTYFCSFLRPWIPAFEKTT